MFLYNQEKSVNSKADLMQGSYRTSAAVYQSLNSDAKAVLMEYSLDAQLEVTACELLLIDHAGSQFHFDFVRLPDGLWREGSGRIAESVGLLFPPEIIVFRFVGKREMGAQIVGAANE